MVAITLFAGAGGADLGMRRAGVHHLACVEGWAVACETLKAAGFPAVNAWIGEGGPLPAWRWEGGDGDILWGSPPCQPYSAAGKRLGADDPRDGWPATLEAIRTIRPRWVIIENVGGAPVESWAADLGGSMFRAGLYAHVSTRTLDAADWGLPSHRVRQFLVAGPKPYRWPEPTHCGPDAPVGARVRLLPWNGYGPALGLVDVVARQDRGAGMMERHGEPTAIQPGQPMGQLRCGGQGGYLLLPGNGGHLPAPRCASEPAHAVTASCPQYLERKAPEYAGLGMGASEPELLALPSAGVQTTEEKGTRASAASNFTFNNGPDRASDSLFLATGRRRLTWQECAVLLGFPADYPFAGGIGAKYKQIGNAVAPVMAEALARAVMDSE